MVGVFDFTDNEYSWKNGSYGGAAGHKDGILIENEPWLVKYPKNISAMGRTGGASYSTSPLSEYIGSHIFSILSFDVHQTVLGTRKNKVVVVCKDFVREGSTLLEIRTLKNHANEDMMDRFDIDFGSTGSSHCVELSELLLHLEYNPILSKVVGIRDRFWRQAIVDILINNNDRNNGNWGILRTVSNGRVTDRLAPVFDNGNCFQSKISEDKIIELMKDEDKCKYNACNTQVAYGHNGHVLSSKAFLSIMKKDSKGIEALQDVVPCIKEHFTEIENFVWHVPESTILRSGCTVTVCSRQRKMLYLLQMRARLEGLLIPALMESMNMHSKENESLLSLAEKGFELLDK